MSETAPPQPPPSSPAGGAPLKVFNVPPKTGQWTEWISRLLNYEDVRQFITMPLLRVLCDAAKEVLVREPNMLTLALDPATAPGEELVLVGDIHGQFHDFVTHVLSVQRNKPADTPDKRFLFLGDYVDRGPQGVEVIVLLLCLKVEFPEHLFLIRGNHEESQTSRIYGFLAECRSKFQSVTPWHLINEVFCELPLAALLSRGDEKVFCCHGGLSPALEAVESLAFVNRREYGQSFDDANADIVDGLLWSDPSDVRGFVHNERGCGYSYGVETTQTFCVTNRISYICRAHQMVLTGYQWSHDKRVLTVFSAPNYCGMGNNKGAIAVLTASSATLTEPTFITFDVAPPRPGPDQGVDPAAGGAGSPSTMSPALGGGKIGEYFA